LISSHSGAHRALQINCLQFFKLKASQARWIKAVENALQQDTTWQLAESSIELAL
jgi:hypothetical protein